jgi:hypothetical protein
MNKTYVIKNTKSGRYATEARGWSKNLFKAQLFDQAWVNEVKKYEVADSQFNLLSKNERFVQVKMVLA